MSDKDLEAFLDNIPGLPKPTPSRQNRGDVGEIDVGNLLQQRIMQKAMQQQGQGMGVPVPPGAYGQPQVPSQQMVYLKEGFQYYKAVPAQESPVPIAMLAGPIAGSVGKEFINKGPRQYYVVENHSPIDLANPDYSKMKMLYAVEAPWIGTILVPESALIKQNGDTGRSLLKG